MRLINADELMEHVWRDKLDSRELIAKMIDNAPTVKEIPTKIPINVFEQLISQEPKTGHWIPVSERLPEEETDVLICNGSGDIALSRGSYSTEVENDFIWYTSGWRFGKVIAWMPLPTPFEPQESEE